MVYRIFFFRLFKKFEGPDKIELMTTVVCNLKWTAELLGKKFVCIYFVPIIPLQETMFVSICLEVPFSKWKWKLSVVISLNLSFFLTGFCNRKSFVHLLLVSCLFGFVNFWSWCRTSFFPLVLYYKSFLHHINIMFLAALFIFIFSFQPKNKLNLLQSKLGRKTRFFCVFQVFFMVLIVCRASVSR